MSLTHSMLQEAGIPRRFWKPADNPFKLYQLPDEWWTHRNECAPQGKGLVAVEEAGQAPKLPAVVELLKRLLNDTGRPSTMAGTQAPCQYLEAVELYAGQTFQISDLQRSAFEVAYLLLANVGQQYNSRMLAVLEYTLRHRYQNGVVTFVHVAPTEESLDAVMKLLATIPKDSIFTT